MARFHPSSPYPSLEEQPATHAEAQAHSAEVDAWLGLQTERIERKLAEQGCRLRAPEASGEKQQLWFGLKVQDLMTPYMEIRSLLDRLELRPGQKVIDLGAGYGRMGFVIGRHHPTVRFTGYEYVGERVEEARRCLARFSYPNVRMEHADLSSPELRLERADHYFIYDYGAPKAIEKTLYDLKKIETPYKLIARGRHSRYLIETRHPWLIKADPAAPEGRVTIYRTVSQKWAEPLL